MINVISGKMVDPLQGCWCGCRMNLQWHICQRVVTLGMPGIAPCMSWQESYTLCQGQI